MTQQAAKTEQISALFAERQRFESWIAALEGRRATTPPHIYARVHADYTARLQRIVEQLGTHRAALLALESGVVDRLTSLDIDEAKHRDELAEAELRASVGELSAEQQREASQRAEAAIARLEEERARAQAELAHLRMMMEAGGGPAAPAAAPAAAEQMAPPATQRATPARPAQAIASAPAAEEPAPPVHRPSGPRPAAPEPSREEWELSFEAPAAPRQPAPRPSGPSSIESAPEANPFDDLEFLKTMVGRNSGENVAVGNGAASSAQAAQASPSQSTEPAASAAPQSKSASHAPLASQSASGFAHIAPEEPPPPAQPQPRTSGAARSESISSLLGREVAPEQVKTLKCQECGTLNYPTEWYCERCGAELAAL